MCQLSLTTQMSSVCRAVLRAVPYAPKDVDEGRRPALHASMHCTCIGQTEKLYTRRLQEAFKHTPLLAVVLTSLSFISFC